MQTVNRLIDLFVPEEYQLSLELRRIERVFTGTVTIKGTSKTGNGRMAVHAKDLTLSSVTVDGKQAEFEHGDHDEVTIKHTDITIGPHIVVIGFSGRITDAMHGMYPCYYEVDGVKKELLATQFESHHAREVFPCIDEPEAKATFDLVLTTEPDITVLGNTEIEDQRTENGKLVTRFAATPRMSTYLLAWATGELQRKSAKTKDGVDVAVWATHAHKPPSLDFALDIAVRTIEFFDEYFGVPYPLKKCDHIALPDFSSGAMENWGLITYREMALLADPGTTSISSKHYIATVIAHELSHMWFGNLVTMKWWNNLWLNESFATLMEYIAIDALHPEWDIWLDFATGETIMALRRDSIAGVQSVQVDVNHPDEISALFDGAIVYAKGARLMRMLEQYLGADTFRKGLQLYFKKHAYGNTDEHDLWNALGEASGKDANGLMTTWISQSGYPVLHVGRSDKELSLRQDQFFIGPNEASDKVWPIPLNASSTAIPDLLSKRELSIPWQNEETVRFNVGGTAHYIAKYDDELLESLINEVRSDTLSPLDRLQLLNEQTLLARGGYISSSQLIPLLDAYRLESTEPVWDVISIAIRELKKFVEEDESSEKKLRGFAGKIASEQFRRLGWVPKTGESESDTKLRATIIGSMLYSEDPNIVNQTIEMFQTQELDALDPELRPLIVGAVVRHGGDDTLVDKLVDEYRNTNSPELKSDLVSGISSTRNTEILQKLLEYSKMPDTVRPQDAARWFASVMHNKDGREIAWQWLQANWPWVKTTFGGDKSYDDYPRIASNSLTTDRQLNEFKTFFGPMKDEPALSRVISLGINEIEGRVRLIERDKAAVRDTLTDL